MKIVNIVCSGSFNQEIHFNLLLNQPDIRFKYNPAKYHGGYFTLENGKATIYKNGKYILVGLTNINQIRLAFSELKTILSSLIDVSQATEPVIQNFVATENFSHPLNLEYIYNNNIEYQIDYEPEQFPGLILKINNITALVFSSGKLVLAGARSIEELKKNRDILFQFLKKNLK
jgi:transcription initiation factor TFIID TATA-box-binding protein